MCLRPLTTALKTSDASFYILRLNTLVSVWIVDLLVKETAVSLFNQLSSDTPDTARKSYQLNLVIKVMQNSFTAIEKCKVPVIAVVNGYCIGGGIDLISACDIVICTEDSKLSIREVKIGMAADLGTLARLPLITKNWSLLNELSFTGRFFCTKEARELGLTSFVYKDIQECMVQAKRIAHEICENSPVAIYGTKKALSYHKKTQAKKGLEYIREHNQSALMTDDMAKAVQGIMSKEKMNFAKL